jgi:class 3 adenylate cyclase
MPKMRKSERAKLPNSAFAYVDSSGQRRLPIHDEAHVRNALARFGRVSFEDDGAQERARRRLLNAAKRYGIVPVGFIDGQLRSVRARSGDPRLLPTGFVTFLFTDIEGSTALLRQLGDRYADLLQDVREVVRLSVRRAGGREVDARADEFFAVFEQAPPAVESAVAVQLELARRSWPDQVECRVRVGLHSGRPILRDSGYIGLSVHTAARVCAAAHGGQILVSGATRTALRGATPAGVRLRSLGRHGLAGLPRAETLYQVLAKGLPARFPAIRSGAE